MTDRELIQQALDALEWEWGGEPLGSKTWGAIEALRARLAQPEPEPCNWVVDESVEGNLKMSWMLALPMKVGTKLYTAPPQREWQSLTDEERKSIREHQELLKELGPVWAPMLLYYYMAIEAKLREKNR